MLLNGSSHHKGLEGRPRFKSIGSQPVAVHQRRKISVVVRIEEGILRPGHDFARGYVHNQRAAPAGVVFAHGACHGFFHKKLHLHVDGEGQILPHRLALAFFVQIKSAAHGIPLHNLAGGDAAKACIERTLKAFKSLVVQPHKAQQLTGHMLEGIHAVIFLAQANTVDVGLAHGLGGVIIYFALKPHKAALGLRQIVVQLLRFHTQDRAKSVGHGLIV